MKNIALILVFAILSCEPDDTTPTTPVQNDLENFDSSKATLLKQGMLMGVNHTASGTASLYEQDERYIILLDPYSSQSGPDLKVYFSKDAGATEYIRVGNLKSTMGKQSYEVPGSPDIDEFHYIHVWCEKYTVVFARAEIR